VPAFNEEEVLLTFHQRLAAILDTMPYKSEVLYVDDGSIDNTPILLEELRIKDARVGVARFTRNFGKERAMSAGLRLVRGSAVVVIDVDLQDPPELLPMMVDAWRKGADVVNMRRLNRDGETFLKKATSSAFYRVINKLSDVPVSEDVGDFRLLSRRAVDALNLLPESDRFMKGLFAWIGFRQITIEYDRAPRAAGISKWNYWKLWNFALDGITSFSTAPLKIATYIGLLSALGAFAYAIYFLSKTWFFGDPVKGFPTIVVFVLLLGGLQLMATGVIGEYLGRTYIESKRRPLYLIDNYKPATSISDVSESSAPFQMEHPQ
jgi:glycosyltransferase involved in cell wall biosynthesis